VSLVGQPFSGGDVVELSCHAERDGERSICVGDDCQFLAMPLYICDDCAEQE